MEVFPGLWLALYHTSYFQEVYSSSPYPGAYSLIKIRSLLKFDFILVKASHIK